MLALDFLASALTEYRSTLDKLGDAPPIRVAQVLKQQAQPTKQQAQPTKQQAVKAQPTKQQALPLKQLGSKLGPSTQEKKEVLSEVPGSVERKQGWASSKQVQMLAKEVSSGYMRLWAHT